MDLLENPNAPGLCFKPDFSTHHLESGEVALLSERQSFVLSGPEYAALEPLLDGSRDADALVDCLSDRFPPERIYYALARLHARGVLETGELADRAPTDAGDDGAAVPVKLRTPPHVHVYTAVVHQSVASRRASGVLVRPLTVSGWGRTDAEALTRCLSEMAERRAGFVAGKSACIRARFDELDGRAVASGDLALFGVDQYAPGERSSVRNTGPDRDPDQYDPAERIDWVAARSLQDDRQVWLPATYCYYAHARFTGSVFCIADSNGCAAGLTMGDAIVRGFLELVERDACAIWWYNRLRRPEIDTNSFDDPYFAATRDALREHGRTLKVFDLTHDLGIPVVAAVSWRTSDAKGLRLGLGARFDHCGAITQALGELNQLVFANDESVTSDPVPDHLSAATSVPRILPGRSGKPSLTEDSSFLEFCVEHLGQRGLEMLVLDQTEPKAQSRVARVVVPGLRCTGARFAPGRLYDVPVALGWRQDAAAQREFESAPAFPWAPN